MGIIDVECIFPPLFLFHTSAKHVQREKLLTGQILRLVCLFSLSLPEVGPSLFTRKSRHSERSNRAPALLQFRAMYFLPHLMIQRKLQQRMFIFPSIYWKDNNEYSSSPHTSSHTLTAHCLNNKSNRVGVYAWRHNKIVLFFVTSYNDTWCP